jgi:hypothetical protein
LGWEQLANLQHIKIMALQLTTTSALSTLAGAQGDLYLNTTNNKLIVFHTAGTGNYDEFTDDGTLGASIELTFNDGGSSDYWSSNTSSGMFYQYFSGADVSGHYKRMDDPAAFQTHHILSLSSTNPTWRMPSNRDPGQSHWLSCTLGQRKAEPLFRGLSRGMMGWATPALITTSRFCLW